MSLTDTVVRWWSRRQLSRVRRRYGLEGRDVLTGVVQGRRVKVTTDRVEVETNFDPSFVFGANLATSEMWTEIEGERVTIEPDAAPPAPSDPVVHVRDGLLYIDDRVAPLMLGSCLRVLAELEELERPEVLLEIASEGARRIDRERAMLRLMVHHPESAAARSACALSEPGLRLIVAQQRPELRADIVDALLEAPDTPGEVLAGALPLAKALPVPRVREAALRIVEGAPSASRRNAIRLLAELPGEVPERLIEIARHVNHHSTAEELLEAFVSIGGSGGLRGLERLLRFEGRAIQQRALAELALRGDRSSLAALHDVSERLIRDGLSPGPAIEAIRERLGAPDGGRLSLAPAGDGSLALASRGDVSLPDVDS